MQRTLIALRGKTNSGKSTALRLVFHQLLRREGVRPVRSGTRRRGQKDIKGGVLVIDGVKAGFLTIAEPPRELREKLEALANEGCVVILCATRSDGLTVKAVASMEDEGFQVVWIDKRRDDEADQDRGNRKKADEVVLAVLGAVQEAQMVGV